MSPPLYPWGNLLDGDSGTKIVPSPRVWVMDQRPMGKPSRCARAAARFASVKASTTWGSAPAAGTASSGTATSGAFRASGSLISVWAT